VVGAGRSAPTTANVVAGTIQRTSYLGDAVDYQVMANDSDVILRVNAPPPVRLRPGTRSRWRSRLSRAFP